MRTTTQRFFKWSVILAILAAAGYGGWRWFGARNPAVTYQTAEVTRGDLMQMVTATGTLQPVTNVQVGSQISGTIAKLYVDFNSPVEAGQVIAQIDPSTYRANVSQAEGDLANAQAALALAQLNARRGEELLAAKLIPQSQYDQTSVALQQAVAAVKLKSASLERAQVDLARCTIYSPVNGTVISRNIDVGQTVAASLSAPVLFVIANDLAQMQINANVAEADIGTVAAAQEVEFSVDAFPARTFAGKVRQVRNAPITVQNVVTYDTIVDVDNSELRLKPGMTANVRIMVEQRNDVLKIPNSALRYRPADAALPAPGPRPAGPRRPRPPSSKRTVYVQDAEGKPQPVSIETGISDGLFTEVREGLQEGDKIITSSDAPAAKKTAAASPFRTGYRRH